MNLAIWRIAKLCSRAAGRDRSGSGAVKQKSGHCIKQRAENIAGDLGSEVAQHRGGRWMAYVPCAYTEIPQKCD
jgi:hypothetical protein